MRFGPISWHGSRVLVVLCLAIISSCCGVARLEAATTQVPAQILDAGPAHAKAVALTFDDGPSDFTPAVLSVLRRYHAHATFFVVGREAAADPVTVRAEVATGDEIGNHTYTHADLAWLDDSDIQFQLSSTQTAVEAAAHITPQWFRPPYGAVDIHIALVAAGLGLRTMMWSVDPRDWSRPGVAAIVQRVLSAAQSGSVIIMHDGGGDRSETVAALPEILQALQGRGYSFDTLDQLFGFSPACDPKRARLWFASAGYDPATNHAIYQAWEQRYCDGIDLGPATSKERRTPWGSVQDFARTGHRMVWSRNARATHATVVWPWAIRAYSSLKVLPEWNNPITVSWFQGFFRGVHWGPALDEPRQARGGGMVQRFRYGRAHLLHGTVTWNK